MDIAFLPATFGSRSSISPSACAQRGHVDAGLRQQRPVRAALLVEQRGHQVRRLEHVVVAPDRQRLRVGQRLLEREVSLSMRIGLYPYGKKLLGKHRR